MVCCRPKRAEVATDKAGVCTILLDVPPQSPPPANCSPYLQGNLNSNICIKEHLCYKIKDRSRLLKTGKTRKSILRQASDSLDCIKTNNVWEKKHLTKKTRVGGTRSSAIHCTVYRHGVKTSRQPSLQNLQTT